ncbi:MAG: OprO/OprP family phosphate-selective porin [Spirochaetia bacterium]|nr:OprO/OprP family phosphate-selective porin [Spirochaetia bacterium]
MKIINYNFHLLFILLYTGFSFELFSQNEKPAEEASVEKKINENTNEPASKVGGKVGGYIQIQTYLENKGAGNIKTDTHDDGLRVRRARFFISDKITDSISLFFQLNANEKGVNLEDAEINYKLSSDFSLKAGRVVLPFGLEIYEDSDSISFAERSRFWSYLFYEKKSNGLRLDYQHDRFLWQNAFFYKYTDGITSIRRQEVLSRISLDGNFFSGIGFLAAFNRVESVDQDSDIKLNAFLGVKSKTWRLYAETLGWFQDFQRFKTIGHGAHLTFEYFLSPQWLLANRAAYVYLRNTTSRESQEVGYYEKVTDVPSKESVDYTLSLAYYFKPQKESDNKSKISVDYNMSFHKSNILAHSFYLTMQACFR